MGEIYWLRQNVSDLPEADDWLSENERLLLQEMKFPKRKEDWRLGRWTAKRLMASHFKTNRGKQYAFSEIEILPAENNAPRVFLYRKLLPLKISISHRAEKAYCALQPQNNPIGCDLEIIESRSDAFIKDYFTFKEYSKVMTAPLKDRSLIANLIWSAKESVLKTLELGLKSDTRSVEIDLGDIQVNDNWNPLHAVLSKFNRKFYGWWKVSGEYILTIFSSEVTEEPRQLENI